MKFIHNYGFSFSQDFKLLPHFSIVDETTVRHSLTKYSVPSRPLTQSNQYRDRRARSEDNKSHPKL